MLESEATKEARRQKTVAAPAKREPALSSHSEWGRGDWRRGGPGSRRDNRERPALRAAAGPKLALRAQIVALAPRHRRYKVGMIQLKLRQAER